MTMAFVTGAIASGLAAAGVTALGIWIATDGDPNGDSGRSGTCSAW